MFCAWMHRAVADSNRESLPPNAPEKGQNKVRHRRFHNQKFVAAVQAYSRNLVITLNVSCWHTSLVVTFTLSDVGSCGVWREAVPKVRHRRASFAPLLSFFWVKFTFCDLFTCVFVHLLFPFCFIFRLRTSIWCVRRSTQNACPLHNAVSNYSFYLLCRAPLIPTSVWRALFPAPLD